MNKTYCLSDIKPGQQAEIEEVKAPGTMKRRFLDIGLISGTKVECIGSSPLGDPSAYLLRGAVMAIRSDDCQGVKVRHIASSM